MLSQAIIYPLELIRTRLAVSPVGHYRGIAHCVQLVLAQEGWRAFYRGMLPSMVLNPPPPPLRHTINALLLNVTYLSV